MLVSLQKTLSLLTQFASVTALLAAMGQTACKQNPAEDSNVSITGGKAVDKNSVLHHSTVLIKMPNGNMCTATLVGPKHLTTAAHCVKGVGPDTIIKAGFGIDAKIQAQVILNVDKWVSHPNYAFQGNDLAILTLKEAVPAPYKHVEIARPEELGFFKEIIYAGYGTLAETAKGSQMLRSVSTRIMYVSKTEKQFNTFITGKGSCYGDSGGPGYIYDSKTKRYKAVGAVSTAYRYGSAKCGQGDTTTDLTQYLGWIEGTFKALGAPLPYSLGMDGTEAEIGRNLVFVGSR